MTVLPLARLLVTFSAGLAEHGDPVARGRPVDPVALVVAGPVGDGDVEVGMGLAGVLAVPAGGVAGEVAFDDDVTGHAALLGFRASAALVGVVVICDPSFFRRPDRVVIGGRWRGPNVSEVARGFRLVR